MISSKRQFLFFSLFFFGVIFAIPTHVMANSLRCENRLVKAGYSQLEVEEICGFPAFIDLYQEEITFKTYQRVAKPTDNKTDRHTKSHKNEDDYQLINTHSSLINIEIWTYNFGSSRFIRTLRFENDKLVSIQDGSYGFDQVQKNFNPRLGSSKAIVCLKYGAATDIQKNLSYQENVTREADGDYLYVKHHTTPIINEKWIYDLGPDSYLQELYFENDRLIRTKSLKIKGKAQTNASLRQICQPYRDSSIASIYSCTNSGNEILYLVMYRCEDCFTRYFRFDKTFIAECCNGECQDTPYGLCKQMHQLHCNFDINLSKDMCGT